jgi:hypothetical protein
MPSTSGSDSEGSEEGVSEEENMNVDQADEGTDTDEDEGTGMSGVPSQGERASPVDVDTESEADDADDAALKGAAVVAKPKRATKPKPPPGHHRGGTPRCFYSCATNPTCDAADARMHA